MHGRYMYTLAIPIGSTGFGGPGVAACATIALASSGVIR